MVELFVSVFLTFLFGGLGWIIFHGLGQHMLRFYDLRSRTHEALFYYANVSGETKEPDRSDARDAFRRLAAQLLALHVSLNRISRRCLRFFDLEEAARSLTGLSNSFIAGATDNRKTARRDVARALRLPLEGCRRESG